MVYMSVVILDSKRCKESYFSICFSDELLTCVICKKQDDTKVSTLGCKGIQTLIEQSKKKSLYIASIYIQVFHR